MNPNTPHTPHDFANQDQTVSASGFNSYDAPVHLAPGRIIMDKFVVIEHLGTGGMGSVFKVQHLHLKTFYALKCLNHKQGNDAIWRRFENEARAANRLDHPNLIRVHDSGLLPDGQPYFVMDLVEGATLSQELTARGTLTLAQSLKIFIQVGFALSYAHANGVIHRDIKPSNIMLVKNTTGSLGGTVKVVDFGIAKLTGKDEFSQQTLTRTGEIFGSPLYMSPEQCMGIAVDHRSDLYSLGCVIYEAMTGAPPVVGDNALSTMLKHQSETPCAMRQASLGLDFPESIEYVVAKLLEKDPNHRYQNASLLTADLVAIEQGHIFKEHEIADNRKTLVSIDRGAKPDSKKDAHMITIIWSIVMLVLGFTMGFFSGRIMPSNNDEHAGSQINPKDKDESFVGGLPDVEQPRRPSFAKLDSKPFSKLSKDGKGRTFEFPTNARVATLFDQFWYPHRGPKAYAQGTISFDNFEPLYLNFDSDIGRSANVFAKFRPDEVGGIKLNNVNENLPEILKSIANYANLKSLSLESTSFSSDDLPLLEKLKALTALSLKGTSITGNDIAQLGFLKQLNTLDCGGVSDLSPALEKLKDSPNMVSLHLSTCNLTEKDLKFISHIPNLDFIDLTNNAIVTDKTIPLLSNNSKLKMLDLSRCKITKASIPTFQKLSKLIHINLSDQNWSPQDRLLLKKTLPNVQVDWGATTVL